MKLKDWLNAHKLLTQLGQHDLAGTLLSRGIWDLEDERVYTVDLETARRWTPTAPINIREHLESVRRPTLTRRACAGRMYNLSPAQKAWLRGKLGDSSNLPDMIHLLYFTARQDDPTIVDQAAIEFLYYETTPKGSAVALKAVFTWAEMLEYSSGEKRMKSASRSDASTNGQGAKASKPTKSDESLTHKKITLDELLTSLGLG